MEHERKIGVRSTVGLRPHGDGGTAVHRSITLIWQCARSIAKPSRVSSAQWAGVAQSSFDQD